MNHNNNNIKKPVLLPYFSFLTSLFYIYRTKNLYNDFSRTITTSNVAQLLLTGGNEYIDILEKNCHTNKSKIHSILEYTGNEIMYTSYYKINKFLLCNSAGLSLEYTKNKTIEYALTNLDKSWIPYICFAQPELCVEPLTEEQMSKQLVLFKDIKQKQNREIIKSTIIEFNKKIIEPIKKSRSLDTMEHLSNSFIHNPKNIITYSPTTSKSLLFMSGNAVMYSAYDYILGHNGTPVNDAIENMRLMLIIFNNHIQIKKIEVMTEIEIISKESMRILDKANTYINAIVWDGMKSGVLLSYSMNYFLLQKNKYKTIKST